MICLSSNKTDRNDVITYNGDYVIDDIVTSCIIKEESNSKFECDMTIILDKEKPKELYDMLIEDSIIRISDEYGDEPFRIASVRKNRRNISLYLRHITIADSLNLWLKDVRPTDSNGQSALTHMLNGATGNREIFLSSDISKISTAYYENMTLYQALQDSENSFLERWGGEIKRRGYNISINAKQGIDRGIIIESGKNLIGFESKTNIDELCTVIYPKGYDLLKGEPVVSSNVNLYSNPFPKEFKYENIKVRNENNPDEGYDTEEEALIALKNRAIEEFTKNKIDVLKATYSLDFVELSKTEEYKKYISMEKVDIWDTVTVREDVYNTDIQVRVISREYDVLKKRRIRTTLSNTNIKSNAISMSDIIAELQNQVGANKDLASYVNSMINAGLSDSYVVLKPNELLIMDSKDINTAVNVTRYNKNGLGFSTTGYYGEYTYGFTIDGKINASLIVTGILSTIMIQNTDGSMQIDLSSNQGIKFKENNHTSLEISGNMLNFYDWEGTERNSPVGSLFSARKGGEIARPGIVLANESDSYMALSYRDKNTKTFKAYIDFDKDKVLSAFSESEIELLSEDELTNPIAFRESVDFAKKIFAKTGIGVGRRNQHTIHDSSGGNLVIGYSEGKKMIVSDMGTGNSVFDVKDGGFNFYRNNYSYIWRNVEGDRVMIDDDVQINGNLYVGGTVKGTVYDLEGNVIYPSGGGNVSNGIPSSKLYRFVKGYEGFGSNPYRVPGESFNTAGYGITEKYKPQFYNQLKPFPCTEKTASIVYGNMLISDFSTPLRDKMISDGIDIDSVKQQHFDAFCSLAMNGGLGAVYSSPMYATFKTNPNDPSIPQRWLTWYINAGTAVEAGLRARRKAEANIWSNGIYEFRPITTITSSGGYGPPVSDNNGNGYIPPVFGDLYDNNSDDSLGARIVGSARKLIGKPYVWGGNYPPLGSSNGTDCSGLFQWAYNDNGVKISRTTYTQIKEGKEVYQNDLQPGDLVFSNFSNSTSPEHVVMFSKRVGEVLYCVEAPRTGFNIRERVLTWGSGYRARRLL